jgi:predicted short-subunit dehydrogenase-like oxidoreductase (DUF2520 family)
LLQRSGVTISAVAGRDATAAERTSQFIGHANVAAIADVPKTCSHAIVAVSDDAIQSVMEQLSGCQIALHTRGALGPLNVTGIQATGVLHPLQTVSSASSGVDDLPHCTFAYGGDNAAETWAQSLIRAIGARSLHLSASSWISYHAAAVFASNYQAALMDSALELMKIAGIDAVDALAALRPLVDTAVANIFSQSPAGALTGPIRRGDIETLRKHITILDQASLPTKHLYAAAGLQTLSMAQRNGAGVNGIQEILEGALA